MMFGRRKLVAGGALVAALGVGGYFLLSGDGYEVDFVVPSAAQLVSGSPVWVAGHHAGEVNDLEVRDGKAIVNVTLDDEYAPLHDGSTTFIEWKSTLGERVVTIEPGPAENEEIPDGGILEAESRQIEIDQVLGALDDHTRAKLSSLLGELDDTTSGSEEDLQKTLASAGPSVDALGQVAEAVGRDGPAIRNLVKQVQDMTNVAAKRRDDVAGTVEELSSLTDSVAEQERALSDGLGELPSTLKTAQDTLDRVPDASKETVPLLEDLEPGTARLAGISQDLSPLLQDLRPAVNQLRPTLGHADRLLDRTPGLLDSGNSVVPQVGGLVHDLQPAVSFLRPYTPEFVGWLGNWGQNFAPYDSQGHVWAAALAPGVNTVNESVAQLPTSHTSPRPDPGEVVGQPWTDANGSGMR